MQVQLEREDKDKLDPKANIVVSNIDYKLTVKDFRDMFQ